MKGIVFTELIEMIESRFSQDLADRIIDDCNLPSGGAYTAVGTYDHAELVALVRKLSELTATPVPDLIKEFGRYLFGRFLVLYPQFFGGEPDALSLLQGIESVIHFEVLKLYPDAQLPRFDVHRMDPDTLELIYHSDRHLEDLAEGLIEACVGHFGQPIAISRESVDDPAGPVRFTLRRG
jgi:hypothetical protein